MKARAFQFLFILIAGIGVVFFNNHLLSAQTAVADSMVDSARAEIKADSSEVEMQLVVATIFKAECATAGCHRGSRPKKDLNLESDKFPSSIIDVTSQENKNLKLVDTANPERSYLLMKIKGEKGIKGSRMPDEVPPLKKEQIIAIEDWILSLKEAKLDTEKTNAPADTTKLHKALNDSSQAK